MKTNKQNKENQTVQSNLIGNNPTTQDYINVCVGMDTLRGMTTTQIKKMTLWLKEQEQIQEDHSTADINISKICRELLK